MARVRVACTYCARGTHSETLMLLLLGCWCSVLTMEANIVQVLVEYVCCDILCEDVGRVVMGPNLVDCQDPIVYKLLYEQVFEINVFCLLAAAYSCCYALATC